MKGYLHALGTAIIVLSACAPTATPQVLSTPEPSPTPTVALTPTRTPQPSSLTIIMSYLLENFTVGETARPDVETRLGEPLGESSLFESGGLSAYIYALPTNELFGRYEDLGVTVFYLNVTGIEMLKEIEFTAGSLGAESRIRNVVEVFGRPEIIYQVCLVDYCMLRFAYPSKGFDVVLQGSPYEGSHVSGSAKVVVFHMFSPMTPEDYGETRITEGMRGIREWNDIWVGQD